MPQAGFPLIVLQELFRFDSVGTYAGSGGDGFWDPVLPIAAQPEKEQMEKLSTRIRAIPRTERSCSLDSLRKLLQVVPDEEADSDKELGALV